MTVLTNVRSGRDVTQAEVLDIIDEDLIHEHDPSPDSLRRKQSNARLVKYMSTLDNFLYVRNAQECLADLTQFFPKLSPMDLVQLVNVVPTKPVEAYLCIEDCDLRFTDAEVDEILKIVESHVPETPAAATPVES